MTTTDIERLERILARLEALLGLTAPPVIRPTRRRLAASPIGDRQRELLALLAVWPSLTAAQVQERLGCANGRAYALLRALEGRGLAEVAPGTTPLAWRITDEGRERA